MCKPWVLNSYDSNDRALNYFIESKYGNMSIWLKEHEVIVTVCYILFNW